MSFLSRSGELSSAATSGDAFAVEGRVNLAEYSDLLTGDVRAWWKERDAGFSAGRLGHRFDTVEKGIDAMVQAGENIGLQASYAERHEGPLSASRVGRVQADVRTGRLTVGGELRHEDIRRSALYGYEVPDGEALLAGVPPFHGAAEGDRYRHLDEVAVASEQAERVVSSVWVGVRP